MAKKKKRKGESASKTKFSSELIGLLLVLVGIIGIGAFGPVGHLIKSFCIFLMGTWWAIFVLLLIILGLYMIIKGDLPKFFNSRLIGLYLLLIALLALSHINYIADNAVLKNNDIFQNTIDNFMNTINSENFINLSVMVQLTLIIHSYMILIDSVPLNLLIFKLSGVNILMG